MSVQLKLIFVFLNRAKAYVVGTQMRQFFWAPKTYL